MKYAKNIVTLGLSTLLLLGLAGCGQTAENAKNTAAASVSESAETEETTASEENANADGDAETAETAEDTSIKIGVLTYNATDSEMIMFRSYLKDYLGETFGVEYYYADMITSLEDEKAFIDQAKEIGCQGVIAFTTHDLEEIVDYCGEDMYYALQNMTPTAEDFDAVKDKQQFLGVVSPSNDAEYESGTEIAKSLMGDAADSSKTWLVFTGGASYGNNMHALRTQGILDVLTASGYTLTGTMEELLTAQTPMAAANGAEGGTIYICPGYPAVHTDNVEEALAMCEADLIASVCTLESNEEQLQDYEKKIGKDVKVGLVDCFSETAAAAVEAGKLDYLVGKYSAMVTPSFVAMLNAIYGDAELVKEDGKAYWINQEVWSAGTKEEFMKLYSESVNIYDNLYGTDDLMALIGAYNKDATHEAFVELLG